MFLQLFNIGMSDLSGLTYVGPNNAVVEGWVGGIRRGVFLNCFRGQVWFVNDWPYYLNGVFFSTSTYKNFAWKSPTNIWGECHPLIKWILFHFVLTAANEKYYENELVDSDLIEDAGLIDDD